MYKNFDAAKLAIKILSINIHQVLLKDFFDLKIVLLRAF